MLNPVFLLSGAVLAASLFFGGGTRRGLMSDVLPELLALALTGLALPKAHVALRQTPVLTWLLIGLLATPLLQLLPLPPSVWTLLPGRDSILQAYAAAQISPPWLPMSLRPGETWRAMFALLPGVALFLGALSLDATARRRLAWVALAVGVMSVPLAMLQVLGGADTPLDFYADPGMSTAGAEGFFANSNHFATFLVVLVPLAAAVVATPDGKFASLALASGLILILLLGLALTGSRSVLILGGIALLATGSLILRPAIQTVLRRRGAWVLALAVAALVIPVALGMGLLRILERLDAQGVAEDARWSIFAATWRALWTYFPLGSGVGSFEAVYQRHEPLQALMSEVVNHTHNDWLEALLEAGAIAAVLLAVWLVWLVARTQKVALMGFGADARIAKAALIGLWLLSLHSLWDYPLRTVALSALFGLLCAFVLRPPPSPQGDGALSFAAWRWPWWGFGSGPDKHRPHGRKHRRTHRRPSRH